MKRNKALPLIAAAALIMAAIAAWALPVERGPATRLGLFTSLPIFWSESGSIAETLEGAGEPHWVRTQLEEDHELVPLDTLDGPDLAATGRLVMAQPRALAPAENVALDAWVQGGGRLVLFADPFLTEHSRFGLGDRRRPQDSVVLSPILRRWGLELTFDDEQPAGERRIEFAGHAIPLRLAGAFRLAPSAPHAKCELGPEGVFATCVIGKGRALIVADAAVLEAERPAEEGRAALEALVEHGFAR